MNIYLNNTPSSFVVNGKSSIVKNPVKLYTSLIDEIEYSDNKRISTSDGVSWRDVEGYVSTNTIIKVPAGSTLRTRGVVFDTTAYQHSYIYRYKLDGTLIAAYVSTSPHLGSISQVNSTTDEEGNLTVFTEIDLYLRFSGYGKGQNFIITIDEEILEWPYDILSNPLKDWVPYSTTEPGGIERFNSTGYKDEYGWSNSSEAVISRKGFRVTGWIPYIPNATVYCYNFFNYDALDTELVTGIKNGITLNQAVYLFYNNPTLLEYDETNGFIKLKLNWNTNDYDYWRISAGNRTSDRNSAAEAPRIYMRYE